MSTSCHPVLLRLGPQSSSPCCRLNEPPCYNCGSRDVPAVAVLGFFATRISAHHGRNTCVRSCLRPKHASCPRQCGTQVLLTAVVRLHPHPRLCLANGEAAEDVDQVLYRNRDVFVFRHKRGKTQKLGGQLLWNFNMPKEIYGCWDV